MQEYCVLKPKSGRIARRSVMVGTLMLGCQIVSSEVGGYSSNTTHTRATREREKKGKRGNKTRDNALYAMVTSR